MAIHTENLIIGAGPAGLAMAGRLRKQGQEFIVLEQSQQVAHSWQNHYDRLHLHTVSDYSHLHHLPFPADFPQSRNRVNHGRLKLLLEIPTPLVR